MSIATTDIEILPNIRALKEENCGLSGLTNKLSRVASDGSSAFGHVARTESDAVAVQMFMRALTEVKQADQGTGIIDAYSGKWQYARTENGKPVFDQGRPVFVDGKTFRFHDPTARLLGSVMLNIEFGNRNLTGVSGEEVTPEPAFTASIYIMNGGQLMHKIKPSTNPKKYERAYASLANYF